MLAISLTTIGGIITGFVLFFKLIFEMDKTSPTFSFGLSVVKGVFSFF